MLGTPTYCYMGGAAATIALHCRRIRHDEFKNLF